MLNDLISKFAKCQLLLLLLLCFVSSALKSENFAQILENFARTCVRVSVRFRNSVSYLYEPLRRREVYALGDCPVLFVTDANKMAATFKDSVGKFLRYRFSQIFFWHLKSLTSASAKTRFIIKNIGMPIIFNMPPS